MEKTLSIIKPDGVRRNLQGEILAMIQKRGLVIVAQKMIQLTDEQAQAFYEVHKERPFFKDLCAYMSSGPVSVQILKGENAIKNYRDLMGVTNPIKAEKDTIRNKYAISIDENTVHGSDSTESAEYEIDQLFSKNEIFE